MPKLVSTCSPGFVGDTCVMRADEQQPGNLVMAPVSQAINNTDQHTTTSVLDEALHMHYHVTTSLRALPYGILNFTTVLEEALWSCVQKPNFCDIRSTVMRLPDH